MRLVLKTTSITACCDSNSSNVQTTNMHLCKLSHIYVEMHCLLKKVLEPAQGAIALTLVHVVRKGFLNRFAVKEGGWLTIYY